MADPLDPFDALVGAFTDPIKRILAYMGVTGGAFVLGRNIQEAPLMIGSIGARGPRALFDVFDLIHNTSPVYWLGMMLNSLTTWYLLPLVLAYLFMFVRLWRVPDMFNTLFVLALMHPLHTYIYVERATPSAMGDRIISVALLVMFEVAIAGLILWWRYIVDNAPTSPAR
jgi:hypothetical protein